jgi:hypothetical protein
MLARVLADGRPAELLPAPAMRYEELVDILSRVSQRARWPYGYEKRFPQMPKF